MSEQVSTTRSLVARIALAVVALLVLLSGWVACDNFGPTGDARTDDAPRPGTPAQVEEGAYLARVGNCAGCHTARGGPALAGGRGIRTPFGIVYAGNITPDSRTGIGDWSPDDFWQAMHHGRSRDGRLLLPVFPYPEFTHITRSDSDALYAWLRAQPAARQANREHELAFPYRSQAGLALWRSLWFRPAGPPAKADDATRHGGPPEHASIERGRYLVEGLGHCGSCHSPRNMMGAVDANAAMTGGRLPTGWYAPSLRDPAQAGVTRQRIASDARILAGDASLHAAVVGPMADVVFDSLQHLSAQDLQSMTQYLATLAPGATSPSSSSPSSSPSSSSSSTSSSSSSPPNGELARLIEGSRGEKIYGEHCADCHGRDGEGVEGKWPALAQNRALSLPVAANTVRVILEGGYAPSTAGNPQPHGMPPFAQRLGNEDIAAVAAYVRRRWGGRMAAIPPSDVEALRSSWRD